MAAAVVKEAEEVAVVVLEDVVPGMGQGTGLVGVKGTVEEH